MFDDLCKSSCWVGNRYKPIEILEHPPRLSIFRYKLQTCKTRKNWARILVWIDNSESGQGKGMSRHTHPGLSQEALMLSKSRLCQVYQLPCSHQYQPYYKEMCKHQWKGLRVEYAQCKVSIAAKSLYRMPHAMTWSPVKTCTWSCI